jgi:hypothetical protein
MFKIQVNPNLKYQKQDFEEAISDESMLTVQQDEEHKKLILLHHEVKSRRLQHFIRS